MNVVKSLLKEFQTITVAGKQDGPHLVVTGAIHGDEPCGPQAANCVIQEIKDSKIIIEKGRVTFVPICNPEAFKQNTRFIDRNLNRRLFPKPKNERNDYEDHIDPLLCPVLDSADVLLDLHSFAQKGRPFAFLGPYNEAERNFAKNLGISNFVHGWQNAYQNTNKDIDPRESQGTTEYSRLNGALAVTLECGQHKDPKAPDVAYRAIRNAMHHFGIASDESMSSVKDKDIRCVEIDRAVYKEKKGTLTREWVNFDPLSKGDDIATYEDGTSIISEGGGFILFPKPVAEVGGEWFLLGKKSSILKPKIK